MKKTNEQGLSLIVVVAVIAVLTVGGVAAVELNKRASVNTQTDAEARAITQNISEARTQAAIDLSELRADIATSAEVNIKAALNTVAAIKAGLQSAYANADAKAQAEIRDLNTQIASLEAKIEAGAADTEAAITNLIDSLDVRADTTADNQADAASETTTTTGSTSTTEADASLEAEATTDTPVENDSTGATAESDSSVELDLDAEITVY